MGQQIQKLLRSIYVCDQAIYYVSFNDRSEWLFTTVASTLLTFSCAWENTRKNLNYHLFLVRLKTAEQNFSVDNASHQLA